MKKILSGLVILGLSLGSASAFAQGTTVSPNAPVGTAPYNGGQAGQPMQPRGGHHPEIRKAMRHLDEAEHNLQEAADDYGGHKAEARKLIEQAKQQLEQALQVNR